MNTSKFRNVKNYNQFVELINNSPKITINKKFQEKSNFESVYIEFRILSQTEFIIRNLIDKLSEDWSHTIVCGPVNFKQISEIVQGIFNESGSKINIIELSKNIPNVNEYNNLLLSVSFWELFHGNKLLIYQSDTILFHGDIEPFMKYDYIGAPWVADLITHGYGGNGGLSLRTKEVMIKCLEKFKPPDWYSRSSFDLQPEDTYFCNTISFLKLGLLNNRRVGVKFAQEQLISRTSLGGHKYWDARDTYDFIDIPYEITSKVQKETKIPYTLVQTFRDTHVHKAILQNIIGILHKNQGCSYKLIDDSLGVDLIKNNFGPEVFSAFNKLKAGAAKGDFIRYCSLYIYGGIYLDLDAYIVTDLSEFLNNEFVFFHDNIYNIIQWCFMTVPKNIILLNIINEMVRRILRNEQNIFVATGPTLVNDTVFNTITGESNYNIQYSVTLERRKQVYTENKNYSNGLIIHESEDWTIFTFPGYLREMLYNSEHPRYTPTFGGQPSPNLYN